MSIPVWLSQATYNKLNGSYIQGDCDVTGNVICRGTNSIWLDTNASIKLNNAGTVTTLSRDELSYLDGVTSAIQTQINGKATTGDVTALQTKTQNITSATATLTTIEDNVTLSTGNLVLTAGDLTVAGTKSFFMNGELNLGSLGRISGTGLTISNAQLAYLNGLTASVETRLASCVQKLTPITYNSPYNTSDFTSDIYLNGIGATQIRTIGSDSNTIQFDDTYGFINFLNKIHMYSEFQLDYAGTTYFVGSSLAEIYNRITAITYNSVSSVSEITGNILANALTITPTHFGYISGLTSSAQTQLTNLQTKTQNITATNVLTTFSNGITVSTGGLIVTAGGATVTAGGATVTAGGLSVLAGTSTFQASSFTGTMTFATGFAMNINGNSRIVLNSANSYLSLGTSLGILTTAGVYINATEMSYLDGATSNLQTQIGNINTSLTDLNLKTTDITYVAVPATTTIANAVALTGSLKVSQQAWLDGGIKLKSTYVAPVTGELGFTTTSSLATQINTFVSNTAKNIVSFTLPIGVWLITYSVITNLVGTTCTSLWIGIGTVSNALASNIVTQIQQTNVPYTSQVSFQNSRVINVSASTTYYLTASFVFTGTAPAVNALSYLEASRIA